MLIFLEAGGLQGSGINFDAKTTRASSDAADFFYVNVGGMERLARTAGKHQRVIAYQFQVRINFSNRILPKPCAT